MKVEQFSLFLISSTKVVNCFRLFTSVSVPGAWTPSQAFRLRDLPTPPKLGLLSRAAGEGRARRVRVGKYNAHRAKA
jgi:hypothetical protein